MPSTMSAPLITLSTTTTNDALLRDLRSAYNTNDDSLITFVPFPTTAILPPPPVAERQRPRRASKTMQRILSSKKKNTKPKTKKNKEWDRDLWDDDDENRDDAAYTLTATVFRHTDDDTPASRCRILSSKKRDTKPTKKTNERKDENHFFDDDHRDDEFRDTTGDDEDWSNSRITIIKATESTPWDTTITNDHDGDDQINSLDGTMRSITVNTTTADNASKYPRIRTPATASPVGTQRYSKTDDDRASLYSNIIPSLLQSWNNFETGIINEINTTTTTKSNSNSNTMIRTILGGGSCYTDTTATAIATVSRPKDSLPVGGRVAAGTLVTNDDVTTSLWSTTNFADIDAFSCGRDGGDNTTNVQATRGIRKNMTMVGHWMTTKTGDTNISKMKPSGTKQMTAFSPPDGTAISDLYTLRMNNRNNDDDGDDDIRDQPGGHTTLSSSAPVATITSAKAMEQRWRHYQQQLRQQQQQQNQQQQNHHRGFTDNNNNKKEQDERKESNSKSTNGLLKQRLERKYLQEERKGFDQQEEKVRRQSKESQIIYLQSKYEAEEPGKKNVLKKKKYKNNPSIINRLRCRDASIATPGQADEDGNYNWTGQAVKAGVAR